MRVKEYLLLRNKNICEIELNGRSYDAFLDELVEKINCGFNFFVISFADLKDSVAFSCLKRARQLIAECNALFIIANRVDFAISLKADGIFLDEFSLEFTHFKEIFSNDFIVVSRTGCDFWADVYID